MRFEPIRPLCTLLALALSLAAPTAAGSEFPKLPSPAVPAEVIADYHRKLKAYQEAHAAFDAEADAYWASIVEKRRGRNAKRREHEPMTLDDYVLTQPPLYTGPKRPVNPLPEPEPEPPERPREQKYVPVVPDLLKAAADYYQWAPQQPANDIDFKRAYASFALSAGLTREQAVRVYAFETGGNGTHASQSGFHGTHAISTAVGYNQLLTTNSVELLAEQGEGFIRILGQRALNLSGSPRKAMDTKIAVLKKMVALARSVPDDWSEHEKIGDTPKGWALHAMVLDIDVGPMLQTHKLLTSVQFARERGFSRPLTAAELEMMNLTGDGTGLDMVTMPQPMREVVATANFFQRSGYERNPVASHYNTVAKLLAITDSRMNANVIQPGAKELAAAF